MLYCHPARHVPPPAASYSRAGVIVPCLVTAPPYYLTLAQGWTFVLNPSSINYCLQISCFQKKIVQKYFVFKKNISSFKSVWLLLCVVTCWAACWRRVVRVGSRAAPLGLLAAGWRLSRLRCSVLLLLATLQSEFLFSCSSSTTARSPACHHQPTVTTLVISCSGVAV